MRDVKGNLEKITAEIVINAAKEEDILALKIVDEAMTYLGIGIDSLIKLFNPEIIVFSGGLAKSGEIFFNKLEKHILENKLREIKYIVKLVPSSFDEDATLIGAFSLVTSKILQFDS